MNGIRWAVDNFRDDRRYGGNLSHMSETTDAAAARGRWLSWVIGGALLVVAGLLMFAGLIGTALVGVPAIGAAALFAIGLTRTASITARRPLGTTALIACGVLLGVVPPMIARATTDQMFVGFFTSTDPTVIAIMAGVVGYVVAGVAAAVVAGVSIDRAGVAPRPWGWLLLVFLVGAFVVTAAEMVAIGTTARVWSAPLGIEWLGPLHDVQIIGTVLLGITAIVVGAVDRSRATSSVQAYAR